MRHLQLEGTLPYFIKPLGKAKPTQCIYNIGCTFPVVHKTKHKRWD